MLAAFQPARARKFTVVLLSEYHAGKIVGYRQRGETGADSTSAQRRQQHPFLAAGDLNLNDPGKIQVFECATGPARSGEIR